MQKMQTSEFLHLLGHFSGSACSWDVLRGGWHLTAISEIPMAGCSLSGWMGCFLCVFLLLLRFSVPAGSAILNRTFRIFHRNFVFFVCRLLDVTFIETQVHVNVLFSFTFGVHAIQLDAIPVSKESEPLKNSLFVRCLNSVIQMGGF